MPFEVEPPLKPIKTSLIKTYNSPLEIVFAPIMLLLPSSSARQMRGLSSFSRSLNSHFVANVQSKSFHISRAVSNFYQTEFDILVGFGSAGQY